MSAATADPYTRPAVLGVIMTRAVLASRPPTARDWRERAVACEDAWQRLVEVCGSTDKATAAIADVAP